MRDDETRDGEAHDDVARGGETRDGEAREGETRDGEARDEQARDGETRDDVARDRRSERRRRAETSGRTERARRTGRARRAGRSGAVGRAAVAAVGAAAVLALTGGALWADLHWPVPETRPVGARVVQLPPVPVDVVCAPAPVPTTQDTGPADPEEDPGDRTVRSEALLLTWGSGGAPAADADWTIGAGAGGTVPLTDLDGLTGLSTDVGTAGVLTVQPAGEATGTGGGAVVSRTEAGDLRGLAAATCQVPSSSAWLVGGATDLGSTTMLVLTNPGPVAVGVDATVHTARGVVDAAALSVVVPPRTTVTVPVEASVQTPALALRVVSTGGQIVAGVQDLRTQGLTSDGLALVTPTSPGAQEHVVGGLDVADGALSVVRLVNPGQEERRAAVEMSSAEGWQPLGGAEDVVLDPGVVLDVPLMGVPEGVHGIRVRADGPVVVAAGTAREADVPQPNGDLAVDRAWSPAGQPAEESVHVLPGGDLGVTATVAVTNPGDGALDVVITDVADGAALHTATLDPGRTVALPVPEGVRAVRVTSWSAGGAAPTDGAGGGESATDGEPPASGESATDAGAPGDAGAGPVEPEVPTDGGAPPGAGSTTAGGETQDRDDLIVVEQESDGVVTLVLLRSEAPTGTLVGVLTPVPDARLLGESRILLR